MIEDLIEKAIAHYKDELSIKLFPFYYEYGDLLVTKLEN